MLIKQFTNNTDLLTPKKVLRETTKDLQALVDETEKC